jgi:error-prone DNA polymerase
VKQSLKGHLMELIRPELISRKAIPAAKLRNHAHKSWVKVAGVVIIRQRPGTAKGIVFETLEDETGVVYLIICPDVFERCRSGARHASVFQANGYVERREQGLHVIAMLWHDLRKRVANCVLCSRDFHLRPPIIQSPWQVDGLNAPIAPR